jgi:F-box protein 21
MHRSDDGTDRYVAQENIGPMPPGGPTEDITRLAGKYFLRWDKVSKRFVSNLKQAYPDD